MREAVLRGYGGGGETRKTTVKSGVQPLAHPIHRPPISADIGAVKSLPPFPSFPLSHALPPVTAVGRPNKDCISHYIEALVASR
jgi:hypothetical protein